MIRLAAGRMARSQVLVRELIMSNSTSAEEGGVSPVLSALIKFNAVLSRAYVWLAATLTIVFFLSTLIEIVSRSLFNYSFIWSGEVATFCFIWALFLSAAVCFRSNAHLSVDVINAAPGGLVDRALRLIVFLAVMVAAVTFTYFGWKLLMRGFDRSTPILGLPMIWGWSAPFAMGAAMIPFAIEEYLAPGRVAPDLSPPSSV